MYIYVYISQLYILYASRQKVHKEDLIVHVIFVIMPINIFPYRNTASLRILTMHIRTALRVAPVTSGDLRSYHLTYNTRLVR